MQRQWLPPQLKSWLVLWFPWDVNGSTPYDLGSNLTYTPTSITNGRWQGLKSFVLNGTSSKIKSWTVTAWTTFWITTQFSVSSMVRVAGTWGGTWPQNLLFTLQWTVWNVWPTFGINILVGLNNANPIEFSLGVSTNTISNTYASSVGSPIVIWKWAHLTTTYNSGTTKHYVNGTLLNTATNLNGTILNTNANAIVWSRDVGGTAFFNWQISNLMVHNRALSAEEVQLYHKSFFIP